MVDLSTEAPADIPTLKVKIDSGAAAHHGRETGAVAEMQSATTVRELAAYHDKLASGMPAAAPKDGARFHGGAGAPESTSKELDALAAKANTPAEHRALEEYFLTLAKRYSNEANEHVTLHKGLAGVAR